MLTTLPYCNCVTRSHLFHLSYLHVHHSFTFTIHPSFTSTFPLVCFHRYTSTLSCLATHRHHSLRCPPQHFINRPRRL